MPAYLYYNQDSNARYSRVRGKVFGGSGTNCTCDSSGQNVIAYVTCSKNIQYSIRSVVYESGYSAAALGFQSLNYIESQTIGGEWSPDSVGRYTYADM